jgi:hypothetical protein
MDSAGSQFFHWYTNHYEGELTMNAAYLIWIEGYKSATAGQPARKGGE